MVQLSSRRLDDILLSSTHLDQTNGLVSCKPRSFAFLQLYRYTIIKQCDGYSDIPMPYEIQLCCLEFRAELFGMKDKKKVKIFCDVLAYDCYKGPIERKQMF